MALTDWESINGKSKYPDYIGGPIAGNRFLVQIKDGGDASPIQAAFQSISGIGVSREKKLHRSSAESLDQYVETGGKISFSDVTFTKGVIGDSAFLRWVLGTFTDANNGSKTPLALTAADQHDIPGTRPYFYGYEDKNGVGVGTYSNTNELHETKLSKTTRELSKTIIVKAYSITGHLRVWWELKGCTPMSYKLGNFNAENDSVLIETVTCSVKSFTRHSEGIGRVNK